MKTKIYDLLEENPVIASVKDDNGLEECCKIEEIKVVFILYGNICNIDEIVNKIKESGKIPIVHIDLIQGLGSKEISVDFIKKYTLADGVISTKPNIIKRAKELKLFTVLRYFILDSMALESVMQQYRGIRPDFVELLPGAMPKIIEHIARKIKVPIIAGGLINDKTDVMSALTAGAFCVSTTNEKVWKM